MVSLGTNYSRNETMTLMDVIERQQKEKLAIIKYHIENKALLRRDLAKAVETIKYDSLFTSALESNYSTLYKCYLKLREETDYQEIKSIEMYAKTERHEKQPIRTIEA